jgi:hypothetical protein
MLRAAILASLAALASSPLQPQDNAPTISTEWVALTTEETPYLIKTPSGNSLSLVVAAPDRTRDRVVIRIMRNASGRAGSEVRR